MPAAKQRKRISAIATRQYIRNIFVQVSAVFILCRSRGDMETASLSLEILVQALKVNLFRTIDSMIASEMPKILRRE